MCACVSGCSAVAKGEEVRLSLGVLEAGKFANASLSVPAFGAPSRDQTVLVAGSSGSRAQPRVRGSPGLPRLSFPLNPALKH